MAARRSLAVRAATWLLAFAIWLVPGVVLAQSFINVPGLASDIGVGADGSVWVTAPNGTIWEYNGTSFQPIPGLASRIAVDPNGNAWVVNPAGLIYRYTGSSFVNVPGLASDIGVGADGTVWVTNPAGLIYRYNGTSFQPIPGLASRIAVDPNGNAWVVNSAGSIYRYTGSSFVNVPGLASDIGVGADGTVWVTNPAGLIYRYNGTGFIQVAGQASQISVDPVGQPWVVNGAGLIYRYTAGIALPVEVIGPSGETGSRSFTLTSAQANSAVTFWLQGNHLGYNPSLQTLPAGKASISLNGGPWLALTNETVTVAQPGLTFEGIDGGIWDTVKVSIPTRTLGALVAGTNTVSFRMNQTDGVSAGFRIIAFNLLDSNGNQLIPASTFVDDDPSLWTAPLNDAADISAGQSLWHTAMLVQSPLSSSPIRAHCADCHAQDGRDLKYFNFSNYAIAQRSQFHGLSQLQGQQIASYIRAGIPNPPAFSSYARPWNPPYQPGPGLNSHSIADWSAGAGVQSILDVDEDTFSYIFPNGFTPSAIPSTGNIDKREIPVFYEMPTWNQWLPTISPMDAYPNFTSSGLYGRYINIRNNLTSNQTSYITNFQAGQPSSVSSFTQDLYNWIFTDRPNLGLPANGSSAWTPTSSNNAYALAHWQNTKLWEVMHEFKLEGVISQSEGYHLTMPTDDRVWNAQEPFFTALFRIGIPTQGAGNPALNNFAGDEVKDTYFTSAWYYLQILLHSGQRIRGGNNPIDWSYFLTHQGKEPGITGLGEAGFFTMVWLDAQNENTTLINGGDKVFNSAGYLMDPDYGYNPAWGAALDQLVFPEYFSYGWVGPFGNLDANTKGALLGTLAQAWLNQSMTWTPSEWDTAKNDDGTLFGGTAACNPQGYDTTDAGSRMVAALTVLTNQSQVPFGFSGAAGNIPVADTNALANFAATIWPACNWSQFLH